METKREPFFTKDISFYKAIIPVFLMVSLQNIVAYSVNMADNIMLGSYSQTTLSGASTVNQVFFLINQIALTIGDSLVILASQYWGQKRLSPMRKLTGIALFWGIVCGLFFFMLCSVFPAQILGIFTDDFAIVQEGMAYLEIIRFTFVFFLITQILMAALRSVETVRISFYISVVSLIVNLSINYTLIFGRFGFPELGIRGAAIGTLTARILEFLIVVLYLIRADKKLRLFSERFLKPDMGLHRDFVKVAVPVVFAGVLWAISVPMQTAILGHLPSGASADVIAANSVATTFYQYLKVIVVAMSSASTVMIGKAIGIGDPKRIRSDARTLAVIDVGIGIILALILFAARIPLLQFYSLNANAYHLADQFLLIMCIVMIGMAYQMPVSMGILRGGGDTQFTLVLNTVSTWAIVMPLSLLSAFVWKWPAAAVVLVIQSDQIFKGVPIFLRMRSYKWIKKLTREEC